MSSQNPEFFLQTVETADVVRWHLELDWVHQGRRGVSVIDDNGRPFATVGTRWEVDPAHRDDHHGW